MTGHQQRHQLVAQLLVAESSPSSPCARAASRARLRAHRLSGIPAPLAINSPAGHPPARGPRQALPGTPTTPGRSALISASISTRRRLPTRSRIRAVAGSQAVHPRAVADAEDRAHDHLECDRLHALQHGKICPAATRRHGAAPPPASAPRSRASARRETAAATAGGGADAPGPSSSSTEPFPSSGASTTFPAPACSRLGSPVNTCFDRFRIGGRSTITRRRRPQREIVAAVRWQASKNRVGINMKPNFIIRGESCGRGGRFGAGVARGIVVASMDGG